MSTKRKTWTGRVFIGRDENGKQLFHWLGRFPTKRERDAAVATAKVERPWERDTSRMTCGELADRYLRRYAERNKASSADTARLALVGFRGAFGARPVAEVGVAEAEDWADSVPRSYLPVVVSMFGYAVRLELRDRNPFAAQAGWSEKATEDTIAVYAHRDLAALDEVDALYAGEVDPAVNDAIDQYVSDLLPGGTGYPSDDAQLVAHDLGAIAIRDRGLLNSASRAASDWASLGLVLRAPIRSPNIREVAEAANRDLMRIDPRINTAPMP